MALYRNIGGFGQVGLSLYDSPSLTLIDSGSALPSPFTDPVAYQQQQQALQDATTTEMNSRYDWLMSHTYNEITSAGYYVTTDDGSIFQWTDAAHTTSIAYLPIADIQQIENSRGTAGTLLLHMQQPDIAKDTAGLQGGDSASWLQSQGVDPTTQVVSDPIPAVQALQPVTTTTAIPTATTATVQPVTSAAASKNNFFPLAILAGLAAVAVAGEPMLHNRRKIVFVGGVGLLFYLIAKRT